MFFVENKLYGNEGWFFLVQEVAVVLPHSFPCTSLWCTGNKVAFNTLHGRLPLFWWLLFLSTAQYRNHGVTRRDLLKSY